MRDTVVRAAGLAGTLLYGAGIVWMYAAQPQTVAEVTGGLTSTIGAYRIDEQAFQDGLIFFRKDQFEEARAAVDGRLLPYEWLELRSPGGAAGAYVKADALDPHADDFFPGCRDAAWDVAGAAVEFALKEPDIERLRVAVSAAAGRELSRPAVAAFRICYAAFQGGLWRMTGESGTVGGARVEVLGLEYLAALREAVEAAAVPVATLAPQRSGAP